MNRRRYLVILFVIVFIVVATLIISPAGILRIPTARAQKSVATGPQDETPPKFTNKVPSPSAPARQGGITPGPLPGPLTDDPRARIQALRESRGQETSATVERHAREAKRQREEHPDRFSEDKEDPKTPKWESQGPTSDNFIQNSVTLNDEVDSGRLRTILPDPHDANTVYVLSSGGGLWKTKDFTSPHPRWVPMSDSVGTTAGGSVAFGRDSDTLYLGTGDPFDAPGGFMVKSQNGGKSWSQPFVLAGATNVRDVKVDTSSAKDIVLVATDFGLFRSANGGATYTQVAGGIGQAFQDSSVWSLVKTSAGWLASAQSLISGNGAIFFSTDRGATWSPIPTPLNTTTSFDAKLGSGSTTYPGSSGAFTGRLGRYGIVTTCDVATGCPGVFTPTGTRVFDKYSFINTGPDVCVTTTVTSSNCTGTATVFPVAYLGSFDTSDLCANYLADGGNSTEADTDLTFSANVPAGQTMVLELSEVTPAGGVGCSYTVNVNASAGYRDAGRTTLAVASTGESIVYAFAAVPGLFAGLQRDLFKSTDGGLHWTALNITGKSPTNPNIFQPDMNIMGYQAWYNQLLLVDPMDSSRNTVYIGGQLSTAKTTDGGNTWTLLTDWLPSPDFGITLPYVHADCHTAAFSTLGGQNTLFFGTDGGLFISTDAGGTWDSSKNVGLVDHLVYSLTASGAQPDETLIGLQDLGTRFRVGRSTVYNQVFGGDGFGVGWSQANDNVSLTTLFYNRYRRSIDNPPDDQSKFQWAENGIVDYFFNFYTPLNTPTATGDPTGNSFFTFTPTFIYRTTDGAAYWNILANIDEGDGYALSNIHAGPPFSIVFRNVLHGLGTSIDLSHIGVAATGGHVALTGDGGANWTVASLNDEVPDSATRLGFHSFTSNVTWATNTDVYVTSLNPSPGVTRIVKSTQGGAPGSWRSAQTGLPDTPITRLLVDPGDPSGRSLFAATDLGVYQTTDGGQNWALFGARLPQVRVSDLYIPPNGRFLRIATYGRGVWEIKLRGEGDDQGGM